MKNICKTLQLVLGLTVLVAAPATVSAQIVPLDPEAPVVTDTVTASGYYLFANRTSANVSYSNPNSLPSYVTVNPASINLTYPELYATPLTINGTTFQDSGVVYNNAGGATGVPGTGVAIPGTGTPVDFLTFTFGANSPAYITVGLDSNYPDTSYYTLVLENSGGDVISSALLNPLQPRNDNGGSASPRSNNDFSFGLVTGITSGDKLVVEGNTSTVGRADQVTLGAVIIDTPEPSTYALMFAGLGAVVVVTRLRRRNA